MVTVLTVYMFFFFKNEHSRCTKNTVNWFTHHPSVRWPSSEPSPRRPCAPDTDTCRNRLDWPTQALRRPSALYPPSPCRPCTKWWSAVRHSTRMSCTLAQFARSGWLLTWLEWSVEKTQKNNNESKLVYRYWTSEIVIVISVRKAFPPIIVKTLKNVTSFEDIYVIYSWGVITIKNDTYYRRNQTYNTNESLLSRNNLLLFPMWYVRPTTHSNRTHINFTW